MECYSDHDTIREVSAAVNGSGSDPGRCWSGAANPLLDGLSETLGSMLSGISQQALRQFVVTTLKGTNLSERDFGMLLNRLKMQLRRHRKGKGRKKGQKHQMHRVQGSRSLGRDPLPHPNGTPNRGEQDHDPIDPPEARVSLWRCWQHT